MIEKTPRTVPSRYGKQRANYEAATIYPILDEALFCTVSFVLEGRVRSIPQSLVRVDDAVYLHGSVGSHFLRALLGADEACISVMLADDLVIAKSAFEHSVNYRSVVLWAAGQPVEDAAEKTAVLRALTEKMVPGSWDYLRPVTPRELAKTTVIRFPLREASAKIRTGWPSDDPDNADLPLWTGLIPLTSGRGAAVPDPASADRELPEHLR